MIAREQVDQPWGATRVQHRVAHFQDGSHVPVGVAQVAGDGAQHGQAGGHVGDAILQRQLPPQPVEIGGLIGQAGRIDGEVDAADAGIELAAKLGSQGDPLGADRLGDVFDFDLFLLGDKDDGIALDDRLAAQCPAVIDLLRRQAHATVMADNTMLDAHPAAATAPLSATWQVEDHAGLDGRVGQQCADLNLDHLAGRLEDDDRLLGVARNLLSHDLAECYFQTLRYAGMSTASRGPTWISQPGSSSSSSPDRTATWPGMVIFLWLSLSAMPLALDRLGDRLGVELAGSPGSQHAHAFGVADQQPGWQPAAIQLTCHAKVGQREVGGDQQRRGGRGMVELVQLGSTEIGFCGSV